MIDPDASYYKSSASSELERSKAPAPAAADEPRDTSSSDARNVFLYLVAFRLVNALCIRTFFQPDEYFQSLEPAWDIAFGPNSGAWITWEWRHDLRSTFHPYLFAAVYRAADFLAAGISLSPSARAELLVAAPKVLQAFIAAAGDYFTWKLGERVYGTGSYGSWTSLVLSVCSAWQWFCSPRTFSNCLETTLTVIALDAWPWQLATDEAAGIPPPTSPRLNAAIAKKLTPPLNVARLRRSLLAAALACVLRPTNILVWLVLGGFLLYHLFSTQISQNLQQPLTILVREAVLAAVIVLSLTASLDRLYYQHWTFPPFRFLYYNVVQSLSVFYGSNDWHYYLSQGYPLLLTTYIPFAVSGLVDTARSLRARRRGAPGRQAQLAAATLVIPLVLSAVAHKEVRFIYPLLPILHVLSAPAAIACFEPALQLRPGGRMPSWSQFRPWALLLVLGINVHVAIFTTQSHQLGPLSVMGYLRHEHEARFLNQPPAALHLPRADTTMTVGFLMPCHSTPWRSHLVHGGIRAWALGCEPPVDLDAAARGAYLDEADRFYADPKAFLKAELGEPPRRRTATGGKVPQHGTGADVAGVAWDGRPGRKIWPEYLVFFGALEDTLQEVAGKSGYGECWRGWSSWVHDDWRRRGHVVVWCLHGESYGH